MLIYTWSKLPMPLSLFLYLAIWPQLIPLLLPMLLPSAQSQHYLLPPIHLLVSSFWYIYERKKKQYKFFWIIHFNKFAPCYYIGIHVKTILGCYMNANKAKKYIGGKNIYNQITLILKKSSWYKCEFMTSDLIFFVIFL